MSPAADRISITGGVVVGDDGSANAGKAVRFAVEEARRRGCTLHVVRSFSIATAPRPAGLPYGAVPSVTELATVTADAELARLRELVGADPGVPVEVHAPHAPAAQALIVASAGADVVVVGARGRGGFSALVLGSTADQVVQHAACPVVVIKPDRSGDR